MKQVLDIDTTSVDFSGLNIVVMDSASNYDTKVLDITIIDINDNAPTFTSDYFTAVVDDGTGSGEWLEKQVTGEMISLIGVFHH